MMKGLLLVLCACCMWACANRKQPPAKEVIHSGKVCQMELSDTVESDTVDLGIIHSGEIVRQEVQLRNAGTKPILILSAKTSCGCTQVEFDRKPIQPGASADISFEFNSKGFYGYQLKHITLHTTFSESPFTIVVTGEVPTK